MSEDSNFEEKKTEEQATPKDSETQQTPQETLEEKETVKKALRKAGLKFNEETQIVPVKEEQNNKEEQNVEQPQKEMTVTTEQTAEQKVAERAEEKEMEAIEERFVQENLVKDLQEPRSSEKEGKGCKKVNESWTASPLLDKQIEQDANLLGITKDEWQHKAASHMLNCGHSGKQFVRDVHYESIVSNCETQCFKCEKPIPEGTVIQYSRSKGRVMCLECWTERHGDQACLNLTMRLYDKQKQADVIDAYLKKRNEEATQYRDKEILHDLTRKLSSIWGLTEPRLNIQNSFYKQFYTNQKELPLKFVEYVNSHLGINGEGGRPHFLSLIAKQDKDPQAELLKICERTWIKNESLRAIAVDYGTKYQTLYRIIMKDLEPMKGEIVEFIRGIVPELRKPVMEMWIQDVPKIHDLILKTEEQSATYEATVKARELAEKYRRRKLSKEQYSEEEEATCT